MNIEGYSSSIQVEDVLVEAGLEHLKVGFQDVDMDSFRSLMIQDYEKYGVYDVEDKQALFKLVKELDTYLGLSLSRGRQQGVTHSTVHQNDGVAFPEQDASNKNEENYDKSNGTIPNTQKSSGEFVDLSTDPSFLLDTGVMEPDGALSDCGDLMYNPEEHASIVTPNVRQETDQRGNSDLAPCMHDQDATMGFLQNGAKSGIYQNTDPPRIRVIVRKRPLNTKEQEKGEVDVIQCDPERASLSVHEPKTKVDMTRYIETHQFHFDDVFDDDIDNESLYAEVVRPLVATVFTSGRGTCFAYGQTGSGKTYTMQPLPLKAASDIFHISDSIPSFKGIRMYVSCYEIYGGKIFDLLNSRQRLEVREDAKRRVQVVGLKEVEVTALHDLERLCNHAACSRSTGSTGANDESSRSHSIMTFAVRLPSKTHTKAINRCEKTNMRHGCDHEETAMTTLGKLSFIDLAGSERGADTYENDKQTRLEGAEINKSLLALKECIRALDMDAGHVPFRGSKLTSVLRDSFIGKNARTVMIANISPSTSSCEHTLNTLRYADRVKEMKKESSEKLRRKSSSNSAADNVSAVLMSLPVPTVPINCGVATVSQRGHLSSQNLARKPTDQDIFTDMTQSDALVENQEIAATFEQKSANTMSNASEPNASGSRDRQNNCNTSGQHLDEKFALLHRQHIEDTMYVLRQEMDLVAKLDSQSISLYEYADDLEVILTKRLEGLTLLQRKVHGYKMKHSL